VPDGGDGDRFGAGLAHRWQPNLPFVYELICGLRQGEVSYAGQMPASGFRDRGIDSVPDHVVAEAYRHTAHRPVFQTLEILSGDDLPNLSGRIRAQHRKGGAM
jgi:hypothetical protein